MRRQNSGRTSSAQATGRRHLAWPALIAFIFAVGALFVQSHGSNAAAVLVAADGVLVTVYAIARARAKAIGCDNPYQG